MSRTICFESSKAALREMRSSAAISDTVMQRASIDATGGHDMQIARIRRMPLARALTSDAMPLRHRTLRSSADFPARSTAECGGE